MRRAVSTSTRPAAKLAGRTGGAIAANVRPPTGLSRRAAILMVVVIAILAMLTPVLRAYVAQQQRLSALQSQVDASSAQVESLHSQIDRWNDDAYVKAQARARFGFVMPGETGYIALGDPASTSLRANPSAAAAQAAAAQKGPWFDTLWGSLRTADQTKP